MAVTFIKRANIESEERFPSTPPEGGEVRQAFLSAMRIRGPLKVTAEEPVSTFSIDVDTASYSFMRASLNNGVLPQEDAVRVGR